MKVAILFGGSGYIASFLLKELIKLSLFDKYFVFDIKQLQNFKEEQKSGLVVFNFHDVREKIPLINTGTLDSDSSWIYNLAAIHREPGHLREEYFDTNIKGANNVNNFAESTGINNIFFTSSIAPYGSSMDQRSETSSLYPETPYGISKSMCELIHKNWLSSDKKNRKLIIVRPSVIYGPGDPGNVYRMIKALKKGTFVIPGDGSVIKAYGYVYGLVDSIIFVMGLNKSIVTYNYAENPIVNLKKMTMIVKEKFGYKKKTFQISVRSLAFLAFFIQKGFRLLGKKSDIHPVRVRKAGFPTNIKPDFLINNGFDFKYNFKSSLEHWEKISPKDFE